MLLHNKNCWVYISFHKKSLHICSHCCFCCQIDNSVKTSSCQFCIFTRIFSLWQEIISFQQDSFHNALPLLIIVDKKCIIVVCFFVYYSSCSLSHILFNNKSFLWNHLLFTDSTTYQLHISHFFSSLFTTILLSKCFQQQYHQKKYTFFNIQHFIPISQFLSPSSYPLIFSLNHPHSMKETLSQPTSHHISIIYPTKFSLSRSSIAQLVRAFGC